MWRYLFSNLPIICILCRVLTSPNSTVFLFSSIDIWDTRKGLQRVIEALEKVDETVPQALQQVVRELEAQRQVWVDYPVLRDVLDIYQSNRGKRKFITLLVRVLNMF